MNSEQFDREFDLDKSIRIIIAENAELLERLNDYDENGIPYWEKK